MRKRPNEELVENYNGVGLYYYSYMNKIVSDDYKMTEQDKQDEKSGNVYYSFLTTDYDLTKDDLVQMAKKIIDSK